MSDRIPSHNLEAEQGILGAAFIEPDSLLSASDLITADDFYRNSHRLIFSAMLDCYQDAGAIDLVTVSERLRAKGEIEQCGGLSYLSSIASQAFTAANVRHHARIVKEKSIIRRTSQWLHAMFEKSQGEDFNDLRSFLSDLEQGVVDISQNINERTSHAIKAIIAEIQNQWRRMADGDEVYIPMSDNFSSMIPHYQPGHVIALAGYTSQGKSTLLAQMVVDACEAGARCLGFSVEDSRHDKGIKFIANVADVSQKRLMTGNISGIEDRVNMAVGQMMDWSLLIYDDIYTIDEMRLKVKKHKLQDSIDIVFLDYIQNIQGEGSQYEVMSRATKVIQKMAKEIKVTFIFVSQVTNESMKANSEVLGLKGAGELAAAPDIVLWIKRIKGQGKERFLDCNVRKNRPFGETGTIPLLFSEKWSRIQKRGL